MKYRCVIFDCDGTLVDTLEDIAGAMNLALVEHGFQPLALEKYRDIVGWGIIRLAELALPQEARTKENIRRVSNYARHLMEEQPFSESLSKPYPGIPELLAELQNRKIKTAVLSNKPDSVLRRIIAELFPQHAFDLVRGLRPDAAPKPHPAPVWELLADMGLTPHETILMGDSEIDMETARNAGCYPLGVSWGFRSRDTLEASGAAKIIDTPGEYFTLP
ncbi:MAG: HAD family hydrolase [Treponema sp.]|jgi:phosphoglycolate phosphatase|nr:HAD family hydrolase [Treponema sp.]